MYVHTVYTCVYVTSVYDILRTNSNIDYGDIYSEILVYTQLSIVSCTFQICFISIYVNIKTMYCCVLSLVLALTLLFIISNMY